MIRGPRTADQGDTHAGLTGRSSALGLPAVVALTVFIVAGCGAEATSRPLASSPDSAPATTQLPEASTESNSTSPARPDGPTEEATLVRVVDGDTIRVIVGGVEERVRYIGMDTPELNTTSKATPEPYAQAATEANARLLVGGRLVLEKDVSERDRYGRLLRDVWIERDGAWMLVNLELVAEGYAQVATYPPDVKYVDELLAAQRSARAAGVGLWSGAP
jgi:micrococcal nuclease